MLLAIDVGNSNVVLGVLDGHRVTRKERLETLREEDAPRALLRLRQAIPEDLRLSLDGVVIATVIPPLARVFAEAAAALTGREVIVVDHETPTGVRLDVDAPSEVGADRYVNLAALVGCGHGGALVVDFGTATTFDVLSPDDAFVGGAIAPGLGTTADALRARAPRLPAVPLAAPRSVVGKNTLEALQSGVMLGYASMVDGMIRRMRDEVRFPVRVYATGGLARVIAPLCTCIDVVDEDLTMHGLARIHERAQVNKLFVTPAM